MKVNQKYHRSWQLLRSFALSLVFLGLVYTSIQAWVCPEGRTNGGAGDPNVYQYWLTRYLKRPQQLDAYINSCGGEINYANLRTSIKTRSGKDYYYSWWDWRSFGSGGCEYYSRDLIIQKTDCDGTMQKCERGYLSAPDYFTQICANPCKLYEAYTGKKCDTITYQSTVNISENPLTENFSTHLLEFVNQKNEALIRLRRAVSTVNELVEELILDFNYLDYEKELTVPDPNGYNHDAVTSALTTLETILRGLSMKSFDGEITSMEQKVEQARQQWVKFSTLSSHSGKSDYYQEQYRYTVTADPYSVECDTDQPPANCRIKLKTLKDQYENKYNCYASLYQHGTKSGATLKSSICSYDCGSSSESQCRAEVKDWMELYDGLWRKYKRLYNDGSFSKTYHYYFHYDEYSWTCDDNVAYDECRSQLRQKAEDYHAEYKRNQGGLEELKEYVVGLPDRIADLRTAIDYVRTSMNNYEQVKEVSNPDAWTEDLCRDASHDTERCKVRLKLESCLDAVNKLIKKGTDEYATNGQIYGETHKHTWICNSNPHIMGRINYGQCEKFGCYKHETNCREVNDALIETDEDCGQLGVVTRSEWVPSLGRNCQRCGTFNTCTQARANGWHYDSQAKTDDGSLGNWKQFLTPDLGLSDERYWRIREGECSGESAIKRWLPGKKAQCVVGCRKPCSEISGPTGEPMMETSDRTCANENKVAVPSSQKDKGISFTCISHCENACVSQGLYTREQVLTTCSGDNDLATDGQAIKKHLRPVTTASGNQVACYDATCPSRSEPTPINAETCEAYGYFSLDSQAAKCERSKSESEICRETVYTPSGTQLTCSCGCRVTTPGDLTCQAQGITVQSDPTAGGDHWINALENYYNKRNVWLTWRAERSVDYRPDGKVIYAPKAYYRGEEKTDVQTCRWGKCIPNDAAIATRQNNKTCHANEQAEYGYLSDNCHQTYTFVRKCIGLPSPVTYNGLNYSCGPQYEWRCYGKDGDESCQRVEVGCQPCSPACVNDDDRGYGVYRVACLGPDGNEKTDDDCGGEVYGTRACQQPTCDKGFTFSDTSRNAFMKCQHPEINFHQAHDGEPGYGTGGYYNCAYSANVHTDKSPGCPTIKEMGTDKQCFHLLLCSEKLSGGRIVTDSVHGQEFNGKAYLGKAPSGSERGHQLFIPGTDSTNYKAGPNGGRCGKYLTVSLPQWTVANYNNKANASLSTTDSTGDGTKAAGRCGGSSTAELDSKNDLVAEATMDLSYKYFADKVDIDKLPNCQDLVKQFTPTSQPSPDSDGFYVCQIKGGINYKETEREDKRSPRVSTSMLGATIGDSANPPDGKAMTQRSSFFAPKTSFIIFVTEGNFIIDTNIYTAENSFKAIIARDTIIIDPGVGTLPAEAYEENKGCRSPYTADLQGFFAAKKFIIPNWRVADPEVTPFNGDLYCDRQLAVAGTLLQWSYDEKGDKSTEDLELPRTFGACVGGDESKARWKQVEANPALYPDYNKTMSPHLFYARPDFNTSAPAWMRDVHSQRYEVAI